MASPFTLAPLPWAEDALAPTISADTIGFHYHKHHRTYVDTLNKLVAGTEFADMTLANIVTKTFRTDNAREKAIFNNAGQVWNHDFFWHSLAPKPSAPSGVLKTMIEDAFGSTGDFVAKFAEAGKSQFGSGWVWLIVKNDKLAIEKTRNAETPAAKGRRCLLTIDVWEHAYYLDYQNARQRYLEAILGRVINWAFATENLMGGIDAQRFARG